MSLPNVVVIGAQKSGTTSLHYYLGLHPEIRMSARKEVNFFIEERNWWRGLGWYKRQFPGGTPVRGESSPNYTNHPLYSGVPERMHGVIPDAKLIYILRDPVDRIRAHYVHATSDARESLPFEEALADFPNNRYVWRSRYHAQLSLFLEHYPLERILVLDQADLRQRRVETLQRVFGFLGVDDGFVSPRFGKLLHVTAEKRRKNRVARWLRQVSESPLVTFVHPGLRHRIGQALYRPLSKPIPPPRMSDEMRDRLMDFLRPDIEKLREVTGERFPGWCI